MLVWEWALVIVWVLGVLVHCFNRYMPLWVCTKLGWHLRPEDVKYRGINATGTCPRCGKYICKDSQGNWFVLE